MSFLRLLFLVARAMSAMMTISATTPITIQTTGSTAASLS